MCNQLNNFDDTYKVSLVEILFHSYLKERESN